MRPNRSRRAPLKELISFDRRSEKWAEEEDEEEVNEHLRGGGTDRWTTEQRSGIQQQTYVWFPVKILFWSLLWPKTIDYVCNTDWVSDVFQCVRITHYYLSSNLFFFCTLSQTLGKQSMHCESALCVDISRLERWWRKRSQALCPCRLTVRPQIEEAGKMNVTPHFILPHSGHRQEGVRSSERLQAGTKKPCSSSPRCLQVTVPLYLILSVEISSDINLFLIVILLYGDDTVILLKERKQRRVISDWTVEMELNEWLFGAFCPLRLPDFLISGLSQHEVVQREVWTGHRSRCHESQRVSCWFEVWKLKVQARTEPAHDVNCDRKMLILSLVQKVNCNFSFFWLFH